MDNTRQRSRTLNSLTGKTALVTGASRGIGRSIALALSRAGAQLIVHYAQDEAAANSVVAEIRASGGRAQTAMSDLATKDGPHRLAEDAQEILGERLDILVANAGISLATDLEQTGVDQFDRLYAVNVRAPYFLVQQLLPSMFAESSIVLVSSLAARAAVGNLSAYAATKGAIESLVKHFAAALGEKGIRVNAVAPGVVETDMSNFTKTDAGRQRTLSMQALKRIAQPADVAAVVAFLASEEARWITGEIVHVDGGSRL
jgi:3-oxoacyl-[acyl-carrier protein] reductase